jgi:maltose alpha-D-glucosyltransferase/alpha-amylase
VRRRFEIHLADQLDIPDVPHRAMLVLLHRLPSGQQHVLALNFSEEDISGTVRSECLVPHSVVTDMFEGWEGEATVDELHSFHLTLGPLEGFSLLVQQPIGPEPPPPNPPTGAHRVVEREIPHVVNFDPPTETHWVPRRR